MYNWGLIIVIVAWAIQLLHTSKKDHRLNPLFLIFYALGIFLLALDAWNQGLTRDALLNLSVFVLAVIAFWRTTY